MHLRLAVTFVTVAVLGASVLYAGEPRSIAAARVATPPTIDGKLIEPCWQTAAAASDFTLLGGKGPVKEKTSFVVAFDDTAIYLGITCRESQMARLAATHTEYGAAVCEDDCVEIFLDPNHDHFNYFHFIVNAKGAQFNESGDGAGVAADWNAVWQSAADCGPDSWSAEIAFPFAILGLSGKVGDTWGLNVCREEKPSRELSSWSPAGAKFAEPAGFGEVTGLAFDRSAYFLTVGAQEWGAAIMGANEAKVKVTNDGATERDLALRLTVTPADGPGTATETSLGKLGPGSSRTLAIPYRISVEGGNCVTVEAIDRSVGGRVCAATGRRLAVPPAAEFSIFKSFYRDDVVVRYHINLQPADLARHQLVSSLSGTVPGAAVVGARRVDKLETVAGELRFDTAALAPGDYRIRADLVDAMGNPVFGKDLEFPVLRRPGEGRRVDIDADNFIRVDGQRIFPLGIYASPGSDKALSDLAAAGFTHFLSGALPPAAMRIVLGKAAEHQLMAWIAVSHLLDFSKDAERRRESLRGLVTVAGAHPAMLMWESIDEPAWGKQDATGLYEGYKFLRALDQNHPVWMNHAPRNPIPELAHFNRGADIAGCDIYPVPEPQSQSNLPNRTIHVVGDETDKSVATVNNEKPIIMVLQGFGWKELNGKRGAAAGAILPTFDESRFMAYDAIVHGARGINYWGTAYTEKPSRFYCELKALVSELRAVQSVLVSPIVTGTVAGSVTSPENAVQMMRRALGDRTVIIAINTQKQERRADFALPGVDTGSLRVLFEDRAIAGDDGRFSDTFGPYATHLYTDDATFNPKRLDFSAELAQPRREQPPTRVPGDLIVNGSFEAEAGDDSLMADGWASHAPFMIRLSREQMHAGASSLQITGMGPESTPLAVQQGISGLKPDAAYTLSAWVKTARPDVEFRIYVEWTGWHSAILPWTKGSGEWQRVQVPFKSEPSAVGTIYAVVQVRGDGTAWFDDVSLVETP